MCGGSSPSPSVTPSPEGTLGTRGRGTDLGPLALSTSAIHLTAASHSTPRINARRHPSTKGFNSDDDIRALPLESEFTKNANASLGAEDVAGHGADSPGSEDLVPSRDVGAGPREKALYRSSSATLPSARPDASMVRASPLPYRTLQRVAHRPEGRARPGSPGNEMVTLEEFLQESGQSAAGASSRDELLSDYFRKRSEPLMISGPPGTVETDAGRAAKAPADGSVSGPGQFIRPSPQTPRHESPSVSPCGQTPPGHGDGVEAGVGAGSGVEKAGPPPPRSSCRGGPLTRAVSLASADLLLRREAQRQDTQPRGCLEPPALGREGGSNGRGGWRSMADCRAAEQRERPRSARTPDPDPELDLLCRTLDPRRLSLAPPKDKAFPLTLPPPPADRRATETSSPAPANAPRPPEDPTPGPRRPATSPDPSTDPQTVWYEYGCV